MALTGSIDLVGYHRPTGGWLLCGWIAVAPAPARGLPLGAVASRVDEFGKGGRTLITLFERSGMEQQGTGFLLFVEAPSRPRRVLLEFGRQSCALTVLPGARTLEGGALLDQCRLLLGSAFAGQVDAMGAMLAMRDYAGKTDFSAVGDELRAGVDELIGCAPLGVVVIGWVLGPPGRVASMTLVAGTRRWPVLAAQSVALERPDVVDAIGAEMGLADAQCGFLAFLPEAEAKADAFLAIETREGVVAYVAIPARRLHGLAAIRRALDMADLSGAQGRSALDRVVGPALRRLQAERRSEVVGAEVVEFGAVAETPRHSVVIPLHGRVDYMEIQMALFAADAGAVGWDIVWVLDDPARRRDALALAESVYARFAVPFRLVLLAQNRGFAPASNAGLAVARGAYVTFMNSDVFPQEAGFLDGLAAALEGDAGIGAVGPLLLFEDGSVQHEGMRMEALPSHGGMRFPIHARKGRRPREGAGVERWPAITGACLMMREELAAALGGFDEDFVVGDFEDCDLCDRIAARGLAVAVDQRVRLVHLERQSQVGPGQVWRRNLTAYNAWLYAAKRA